MIVVGQSQCQTAVAGTLSHSSSEVVARGMLDSSLDKIQAVAYASRKINCGVPFPPPLAIPCARSFVS